MVAEEIMPKNKYKIDEKIKQLPRNITVEVITKILQDDHNINRATFYRDRAISLKDVKDIPSERLDIYAALFGCTAEELKNYKVSAKSLKSRNIKN